jgi:hypothetical protein
VAPRGEFVVTGLAKEILNRVVTTVMTVADEGMYGGVGDPVIVAVGIGAGMAVGVDCLLASSPAFQLTVRHHGSDGSGQ